MDLQKELQDSHARFNAGMAKLQEAFQAENKAMHEKFAELEKTEHEKKAKEMDAIIAEASEKLKKGNNGKAVGKQ
jgi:hypothetical protein